MEWGTPVWWGKFLLFCVPQSVKTKETNPTRPGSPTPCKRALKDVPNARNARAKGTDCRVGLKTRPPNFFFVFLWGTPVPPLEKNPFTEGCDRGGGGGNNNNWKSLN